MYSNRPPPARTYQAVAPLRFAASATGERTYDEMAEFMSCSRSGFESFRAMRGHGTYGPKATRQKNEDGEIIYTFSDEAVAEWLLNMSATEQHWLSFCQISFPSETIKTEAEALRLSMVEARNLIKK